MFDKNTNTLYYNSDNYFGIVRLELKNDKTLVVETVELADQVANKHYDHVNPFAAGYIAGDEYIVEALSKNAARYGSPGSRYYYGRRRAGGRQFNSIDSRPTETSIILTTLKTVEGISPLYEFEYKTTSGAKKALLAFTSILEFNSIAVVDKKTKVRYKAPPRKLVEELEAEKERNKEEIVEEVENKKPAGIFKKTMLKGINK